MQGCQHERTEFLYRRDGTEYVRCLDCGQVLEAEIWIRFRCTKTKKTNQRRRSLAASLRRCDGSFGQPAMLISSDGTPNETIAV